MHVYTCHQCEHDFTIPPPELTEQYEQNYFEDDHRNWFAHPNLRLFRKLIDHIGTLHSNKKIAVLDVGCGRGDFLKYYRRLDSEVQLFGIDITDNKNEQGIVFFQGDFFSFQPAEKFHAIVSIMVIEHVSDPHRFLDKICQMMRPGGTLCVVTINNGGVLYRLVHYLKCFGIRVAYERLHHHHHLQHYSNESLKALLTRNNLELVRSSNHNFPLAALDVPRSSKIVELFYRGAVGFIFMLTTWWGGMNQTMICRKK